jgi:hypothetical protein
MGNIVNRVFDSSGPEGKVRGTPQQIIEKYTQLARDAQLSNDRVATENFQQHAEHYTRMLNEAQREQEARREQHENMNRDRPDEDRGDQRNDRRSYDRDEGEPEGRVDQQDQPQDRPPHHPRTQHVTEPEPASPRYEPEEPAIPAPSTQNHEPQPEFDLGPTGVLDMDEGRESGLVETPEGAPAKPRKPRAPRKPRVRKPDADSAGQSSAPDTDSPQEAAE